MTTTTHACAVPKKADPTLVWQCNCGQYWMDGAAVAALKAREAAAEQAYTNAAIALAERSAAVKKFGYGPKLGARSITKPDTSGALTLADCDQWAYWQHDTGKTYLMMLRYDHDQWLIDTRWCKADLLRIVKDEVPNIEDRIDNNRVNGLTTAFNTAETTSCRTTWLAGMKKRFDHGYTLVRSSQGATYPTFTIGV